MSSMIRLDRYVLAAMCVILVTVVALIADSARSRDLFLLLTFSPAYHYAIIGCLVALGVALPFTGTSVGQLVAVLLVSALQFPAELKVIVMSGWLMSSRELETNFPFNALLSAGFISICITVSSFVYRSKFERVVLQNIVIAASTLFMAIQVSHFLQRY